MFSVGLFLDRKGRIEDVLWKGPAFDAGLAPAIEISAINGIPYSPDVLRTEVAKAHKSGNLSQITAKGDGVIDLYTIRYDGGVKYPHLVREPNKSDYLQQILAPKSLDGGSWGLNESTH
jgi:predicted metalloprotease with PDZ domain